MNRDLVDAGAGPGGVPGVHAQTYAVYRLIEELKARFPSVEIESCSSGGARVDLGIIEYTDRVGPSDCIDPLERQSIDRWTKQLLPPELVGSHVASSHSHTTGRVHELSFRAGSAVLGHFGIEWDLNEAAESEVAELADWIVFHKAHRALLHSGDVVRIDEVDPSIQVNGIVAPDRSAAVFSVAFVDRPLAAPIGRITFRGLAPDLDYRVQPVLIGGLAHETGRPNWFGDIEDGMGQGIVASGRTLAAAGVQLPNSQPDRAWLFTLNAVSQAAGPRA